MNLITRGLSFGRKVNSFTLVAMAVLVLGSVATVVAQSQFPQIERRLWKELEPWGQNKAPDGPDAGTAEDVIWNTPADLNNIPSTVRSEPDFDDDGGAHYGSIVVPGFDGIGKPNRDPEDGPTPYGWDEETGRAAALAQFNALVNVGECTFSHMYDYDLHFSIYWPQHRLCKGPNGEELPPPPGRLLNPVSIAMDGQDVYVADLFNHRIQVFDFYGRVKPVQFPIGNGVPASGTYNYDLTYPSLNYRPYPGFNGGFSGHRLSAPHSIALDGVEYLGTGTHPLRNLLIADSGNYRIALFKTNGAPSFLDEDGEPIHFEVPTPLDPDGEPLDSEIPFKPDLLAISPGATLRAPGTEILEGDPDFLKRIVVADHQKCWLAILDVGFNLKKTLPERNPADPQHDACVEPADGNRITEPGEFSTIKAVKVAVDGTIYVADHVQNVVQVMDNEGGHVAWIGRPGEENPGDVGELNGALKGPVGLMLNGGKLAVIDEGHARVMVYGLENGPEAVSFQFQLDTTVAVDDFPMSLEMQVGPAPGLDPKGRILVTDPIRRRVLRFELPDLIIANLTANEGALTSQSGVAEFDLVVPTQKTGAVMGVTVTITADPSNVIVGAPTPSGAVNIAPGQIRHYTFPYTLPPGVTRATFTVKASGDNGLAKTDEASDSVRLRCTTCTATHKIYPDLEPQVPPGPEAVLHTPTPTGDWYGEYVYVRITPTGSIPATHIGWQITGEAALSHGEDVQESPIRTASLYPGGYFDVLIPDIGYSTLTYWPITAAGEGDPTLVELNIDVEAPRVSFIEWTPPQVVDQSGVGWHRTNNGLPAVVGKYVVTDEHSGWPGDFVNGEQVEETPATPDGQVSISTEGRRQSLPIQVVDHAGNTDNTTSGAATLGRYVYIDNSAPVFANGTPTVMSVVRTGTEAGRDFAILSFSDIAVTAIDAVLGDGSEGSGVSAQNSILANPGGEKLFDGDTFLFRAVDLLGNAREHRVTIRVINVVRIVPTAAELTYGDALPANFAYAVQNLPPGVTMTAPTCGVSGSAVNVGSYVIVCSGAVASDPNVVFDYATGNLAIVKATPIASVVGGNFVYDAQPHPATACTIAGVNGQVWNGTLSYSTGTGAPVNAGTVTATCTFDGNANYHSASAAADIVIAKVTPVITVNGGPFVYDGLSHPATCSITGVVGVTPVLTPAYAGGSAPRNAGAVATTCSWAGNANHNSVTTTRDVVVTPRNITVQAKTLTKVSGTPDPNFAATAVPSAYTVTVGSLVAGDAFAGVLARAPGSDVNVPYAITRGTFTIGPVASNYNLTFLPGSLTILPAAVNIPPVALADSATSAGAAPVTISVLSNDSDADGGVLQVTGVTQPTGGASVGVVTTSGNLVVFSPAPGFVGTATFSYTISDGQGGTATAQVTVTITEPVCSGTAIARVRKMPTLDGRIEGSVQLVTAANVTFNSSSTLVGDLLMMGVPTIQVNGTPAAYGGAVDGTGLATPTGHVVLINSGASLGRIVRKTNAVALPTVNAPPAPTGTVNVTLNSAPTAPVNFTTLRNLTLNSNVGAVAVPAGTYGAFTANSGSSFVIGVAGSTTPAVYNFEQLTLNSGSSLQVVGPVVVTVKNQSAFNGGLGNVAHPEWLTLRLAAGGLTVNSGIPLYGYVEAPNGTVIVNGGAQLVGGVAADQLTVNSNGRVILRPACATNQPPTVSAGNRSTARGTPVSAQITGSDPDGDALTYTASGLPTGLSMNAAGAITGTPTVSGTFTVTVTVTDIYGATGTATFVWTVFTPNLPPVATDDATSSVGAAPVSLTVLTNDADADGGVLSLTGVTQPTGGAAVGVVTTSGNQIVFTPTVGFIGTATFTYTISDGQGGSATATVTVTIAGTSCSLTGFTTYTQGGWGATPSGNNPAMLLQNKFGVVYPAGSVVIGGTKKLTFTSSAAVMNFLPAGGTAAMLAASATNPTTSAAGVLAGQVLALQLNVDFSRAGVTKPGFGELMYQGFAIKDVLAAANQVLGGDSSILAAVGLSMSELNAIVDSLNNNFDNGTVNNGAVTCPVTSCAATTIVLNASSSTSGTAGNIRTFTGTGVSVKASAFSRAKSNGAWAPAFLGAFGTAGLGVTDGSEGSGADDSHKVDNIGDRHNYLLFEFSKPVVVTRAFLDYIGVDGDATIWVGTKTDPFNNHVTLSDAVLTSLGAAQSNSATSTADRWATFNGSGATANVLVIAADVNDTTPEDQFKVSKLDIVCAQTPAVPPTVTASNKSNDEGATVSVQIAAEDPDDQDLTYSASGLPPGLSINATTGLITGTLGYASAGTYNVTVTVEDEDEQTDTATFVWTVANKNRPPTVVANDRTDNKGASVSFQLAGSDPDSDAITYVVTGLPSGAALGANGVISGTLTAAPGTYTVSVTVKDPSNATGTDTFIWIVKAANRAPTVSVPDRTDNKGTSPSVQVTGSDLDGDTMTYSATGLPPGMTINSTTGKITGTLTTAGTYNVTVTVKDSKNATGTDTFCWTVKASNAAPDAKNDSLTTRKNTSKTISVIGNDTDANGDSLSITAVSTPSKGSVVKYSNGTIKYTPASNWVGTTSFTYTISDGQGGSDTATVSVTVTSHSDSDDCDDDHDHNGSRGDRDDRRERDCDRNHSHNDDCERH